MNLKYIIVYFLVGVVLMFVTSASLAYVASSYSNMRNNAVSLNKDALSCDYHKILNDNWDSINPDVIADYLLLSKEELYKAEKAVEDLRVSVGCISRNYLIECIILTLYFAIGVWLLHKTEITKRGSSPNSLSRRK